MDNKTAKEQTTQIIKQIIKSWKAQNKVITEFFTKYEDSFYFNEVAPERNRAIYIFGHLIGMNDMLFPMLELGEKLFPQLESLFVSGADKSVADIPTITTLREYWGTLNQTLGHHFNELSIDEWFQRHTKVSEEDFAMDPLRNKLNVFIGRINHLSYHSGQLALLNPRS